MWKVRAGFTDKPNVEGRGRFIGEPNAEGRRGVYGT